MKPLRFHRSDIRHTLSPTQMTMVLHGLYLATHVNSIQQDTSHGPFSRFSKHHCPRVPQPEKDSLCVARRRGASPNSGATPSPGAERRRSARLTSRPRGEFSDGRILFFPPCCQLCVELNVKWLEQTASSSLPSLPTLSSNLQNCRK